MILLPVLQNPNDELFISRNKLYSFNFKFFLVVCIGAAFCFVSKVLWKYF